MSAEQDIVEQNERGPDVVWREDDPALVVCPDCGEARPRRLAACPRCEVQVVGIAIAGPLKAPRTFGIGSVMVVIAIAAVCFALARVSFVLGFLGAMTSAIALLRTYAGLARSAAVDWPLTTLDKVALFGGSVFIAMVLIVMTGIAFAVGAVSVGSIAFVAFGPVVGAVLALAAGGAAAGFIAHHVRLALWPIRFWVRYVPQRG